MRYFFEFLIMLAILGLINYHDKIKQLNISINLKESPFVQFVVFVASIIVLVIAIRLLLLPYFIARNRNHRNKIPILLTTLFFGWSLMGWLVAIIWSTTCNIEVKESDYSHHLDISTAEKKPNGYADKWNRAA